MKCVKLISPAILRLSKFINIDQIKVLVVWNHKIFCVTYSKNIPSGQKIHVAYVITYVFDFQFIECVYFDEFWIFYYLNF